MIIYDPVSQLYSYTIYCVDAVELMSNLDPGSIDLIITDPPYESLEKHRKQGTTTRLKHSKASSNDWFKIFHNDRFESFFEAAWNVLKKNTHLYVMCDLETLFVIRSIGEKVGFKFWNAIVWDKVAIGMGYHYRRRYELVAFFEKGKRRLADLGVPDVLQFKRIKGGYPGEKPVELLDVLIRQSSDDSEIVLDPFCGSGSTGVAALRAGRRFIGGDLCQEALVISVERIEAAYQEFCENNKVLTGRKLPT